MKTQHDEQGHDAGWRPIAKALQLAGVLAPRRLIVEALSGLKLARRREERRRACLERVSFDVLARDAVWTLDATQLCYEAGEPVMGEVLRDPAGPVTLSIRVGPHARARDVLELLAKAAWMRGGLPLVLQTDNALAYLARSVQKALRAGQVIHLLSRVHTPTDNASEEHGIGELKAQSGLDGRMVASTTLAGVALFTARHVLDHKRLRATRGYQTGAAFDASLQRADTLVRRGWFYAICTAAMERAVLGLEDSRAVRAAQRRAIQTTLETFGLARLRGPWDAATTCAADPIRVE